VKTAKQLLEQKSSDIWSVTSRDSVIEAAKLMAEKGIGAVLVLDDRKLVGIVSERDYVQKVVLDPVEDLLVREIMTRKVICVGPQQTSEECLALMSHKGIRHLPVMDGQVLLGVISIKDVVKDLVADKEFIIDQLENYITVGY
jgi:CBS domain-containing protein